MGFKRFLTILIVMLSLLSLSNCVLAEEKNLDNLFTDYTHTEVSPEWTLEKIEEKYKELNQSDSRINDLKRALSVKAGAVKPKNTEFERSTVDGTIEKTGDIKGHVRNDLNLDSFGTNFQPMGLNAKGGSTIKVFAENLPNNTTIQISFEQILSDHWGEWYFKGKTYLHNGENIITVPSYKITAPSGTATEPTIDSPMIYVSCPYNNEELPNNINLYFEGVSSHPVFRMDKGENSELFKQNLRKQVDKVNNNPENTLDVVELVSQHTIMAVRATRADELLSQSNYDVVRSLKAWDDLFEFMFKFDGIKTEDDPLIQKAKEYFTVVQDGHGALMYTGEEYIGVHVKNGGEDSLIDCYGGGNKSNIGWGLSHEVGHALDNDYRLKAECTNNLFANAYHTWINKDPSDGIVNSKNDRNQSHLDKVKKIAEPDFIKGSIWNSSETGYQNYLVFSLLESYHPGYWGEVDSYFRDPNMKNELSKLKNANEKMVYLSSKVINCDLGYWFEDFGITLNGNAKFKVNETSTEYNKMMQALHSQPGFRTDEIPFWDLDVDQYMLAYQNYNNPNWGNLYGSGGQSSRELAKPSVLNKSGSWEIMMSDGYNKQRLLYEVAIFRNGKYERLGTTTTDIFTVKNNPSEDNIYVRALDRKLNWSDYTPVNVIQDEKPVQFDSKEYDDLTSAVADALIKEGDQTITVKGNTTLGRYPKQNNAVWLYYIDIPISGTENNEKSITIKPVGDVTVLNVYDEVFKIENATLNVGSTTGNITFNGNCQEIKRDGALFDLGKNGKLNLTNVTFNNWFSNSQSAVVNAGNNVQGVTISNCTFNNCGSSKGVIYSNDSLNTISNDYKTIELSNCNFNNCYAKESTDFGVVTNRNGVIEAIDCTFTSCSGVNGGAVWSSGKTVIEGCTFNNCQANDLGGAIYISESDGDSKVNEQTTVKGCHFKNCNSAKGRLIAVEGNINNGLAFNKIELLNLEDLSLNNGDLLQDILYVNSAIVGLSGNTKIDGNIILSKGSLNLDKNWNPSSLKIELESSEPGQKLVFCNSSMSSNIENYLEILSDEKPGYVNNDGAFELAQAKEHKIEYNLNSGKWIGENQAPTKYSENVRTDLPVNIGKGNKKFIGWFKDENFEGSSVREVGLPGDNEDITLYAKWSGEDQESCKHEWSQKEEKSIVEATCAQQGYKILTKTCETCGLKEIEEQYTSKTSHQFGDPIVESKPATCTEYGTKTTTRICSICQHQETTTETLYPTGHSWGSWITTKQPTSTTTGTRTQTCTKCGQTNTETIPATGSPSSGNQGGGSSPSPSTGGGGSSSGGGGGGGSFGPMPVVPPSSSTGQEDNKTISVTEVKVSPTSATMEAGETLQLNATVSPSNATDKTVSWSSKDSSVASISQSGLVTAKSAGITSVSVKTKDGDKTAVCSITVKAKANTDSPTTKPDAPTNPEQPAQPNQPSGPNQPEQPSQPTQQNMPIYRLYNAGNNEHLYTSDANEVSVLAASGWTDEGVGWNAPTTGEPVYRLYSPVTNEHHYTKDTNEVAVLKSSGWSVDNGENPLFYSGGTKPVYRLYHEGTQRHHLTTDESEYNILGAGGWNQEGIALSSLS